MQLYYSSLIIENALICEVNSDEIYMQRCIELATLGQSSVSPNPMVGSVIVCEGKIIGEGFHQHYGQAHAEVNAINAVLSNFPDADALLGRSALYVNLEPCAHVGKTPPCSDLIIKHRIPKVLVGCRDSFSEVNGKGIDRLQAAGIEVKEGVLEKECRSLNKRFFTRINKQRPYIILKWAQTADGYFAPEGDKQVWITSAEAKQLSHKWRSEEDAILVGCRTALIDNPQLNVREWTGRNPKRIIIDRDLKLPANLHLFDQSQETLVFNSVKTEINGQIKYLQVENFDSMLPQSIAYQLYLMDIQSLIIEGGSKTLLSFIKCGLWDEARVFTGPQQWGKGLKAPNINQQANITSHFGPDKLQVFFNEV